MFELLADIVLRGHERLDVARHDVGQVGQTLERNVADRNVGSRSGRRAGRSRTDNARTDDEDLGGFHSRDTAQKHPLAAARLLQEITPLLRGHAARHLGHGDEQRQRPVRTLDRLVGAADGAAVDHRMGQRFAARKMEIGEDQLVATDQLILRSNGFLDLDDHLGRGVDLLDRRKDPGSDSRIGLIRESAVHTGRRLQADIMAPFHQFVCTCGGQRHAIFVVFDLFGNTDNHKTGSF